MLRAALRFYARPSLLISGLLIQRNRGIMRGSLHNSKEKGTVMAEDIMKIVESRETRKDLPQFDPGDTIKVHVKVREGDKERIQIFQGVVISRKGGGTRQMFTVRKISGGVGVERMFPLYSPTIDRIEVERHGRVRRAKLYYLRDLRGKAARIEEKRKR
ncbi:MAG: large subunit ribosomal protein [Acidobacteriota bacterium]|jgi:large subunit ribosomal protein L19|nr:large subunit ribosomal protein [Acidobacteriota bacterium]